jgi:hypothetical protein
MGPIQAGDAPAGRIWNLIGSIPRPLSESQAQKRLGFGQGREVMDIIAWSGRQDVAPDILPPNKGPDQRRAVMKSGIEDGQRVFMCTRSCAAQ